MDYGTIIEALLGARYGSLDEFVADVRMVSTNCETYWRHKEDGAGYIQDANNLLNAVLTSLGDTRVRGVEWLISAMVYNEKARMLSV